MVLTERGDNCLLTSMINSFQSFKYFIANRRYNTREYGMTQ